MMFNLSPLAFGSPEARTGDTGNEPTTGFSKGTTVVRVHHTNGDMNTHFLTDETIHINVTTDLFTQKPTHSKISLYDYTGATFWETPTAKNFKQITAVGNTRTFEGSFDTNGQTPALTEDHYLLEAELRTTGQGGVTLRFYDVIKYGSGGSAQKSITLGHDLLFTQPAYKVTSTDKIYAKVYTTGTVDKTNSKVRLLDYHANVIEKTIDSLTNNVILSSGSYTIIEIDFANDFPFGSLPGGFTNGDWFTVQVDLVDGSSNQMANEWSAQVQVMPPPVISGTDASPGSVEISSTDTTDITVNFTDSDAASPDEFKITISVRDEANNIYTIIRDKTSADPNLVITDLGGGNYQAVYTWDPPVSMLKGKYDLYSKVVDGNFLDASHDFSLNLDELELTTVSVLPSMQVSAVSCDPAVVDSAEAEATTITADFTDPVVTPREDLNVTFKIRSETNSEIVLVDAKGHGGAGEFGGTLDIVETSGFYTASYVWDPAISVETGYYDLSLSVKNPNGYANDTYDSNLDELLIQNLGLAPTVNAATITAAPAVIDKIGPDTTTFTGNFTDTDAHAIGEFNITLKVRAADDSEILLLDGASNGQLGKLGGTVSVQLPVPADTINYTMTYTWNPDMTIPSGLYDIYFEVVDLNGKGDFSDFGDNLDKLEITSSVDPPVLTASGTHADPAVLNRIGSGTTRIYADFFDSKYTTVNDFNITFKVKKAGSSAIILVDSKKAGGAGEFGGTLQISATGSNFSAEYYWDPPETTPVGKYDLFFSVENRGGGYAEDGFGNNIEELEILTTPRPPKIVSSVVSVDPAIVEISNMNTTTISAEFTDADLPMASVFKITFKVRNETGTEIVLVDKLGHGSSVPLGGTLSIVNGTVNGTYTASYVWDPDNDTSPGLYDLYFSVQDETLALIEDTFTNNPDELELTFTAEKNETPYDGMDVSDIDFHHEEGHDYNITITYTNDDNLSPDENGVIIIIDGVEHEMHEADHNDTDYTDGKVYYFHTELGEEDIEYSIKVNDTAGHSFESPHDSFTPEEEEEHEEDHEEADTQWQVILAIILILIVLVLVMVLTRRKKPEEEMEGADEPLEEEEEGEEESEEEDEDSDEEPVQTTLDDAEEVPEAEPAGEAPPDAEPAPEAKPVED
jgi:hypothetical protein